MSRFKVCASQTIWAPNYYANFVLANNTIFLHAGNNSVLPADLKNAGPFPYPTWWQDVCFQGPLWLCSCQSP